MDRLLAMLFNWWVGELCGGKKISTVLRPARVADDRGHSELVGSLIIITQMNNVLIPM